MPDFKIVRKGYEPSAVDGCIQALYNQISEYKEKEAYINKAIISAEMAASDVKAKAETERAEIVNTAKAQAEKILADAKSDSERLLSKTQNQIALIHQREKDKMDDLKLFIEDKIKFLSSFNSDYQQLVNKYFEKPHNEDFEKLNESLKNIITLIDNFQNSEPNPEQ